MKRRTFIKLAIGTIIVVLCPWIAQATPFVVCNEYLATGILPDYFNIKVNGANPIRSDAEVLANGNRRLHYDVGPLAAGTYHMEISAVKDYGVEGVAESAYVPFDYVKPVKESPVLPANIKLEP